MKDLTLHINEKKIEIIVDCFISKTQFLCFNLDDKLLEFFEFIYVTDTETALYCLEPNQDISIELFTFFGENMVDYNVDKLHQLNIKQIKGMKGGKAFIVELES